MFSLDTQMVKITSVNLRAERHGDELVPACDIGVIVDLPNTCLAEFHPELRSAFYRRDESAQSDMLDGDTHLPMLKFPGFPTIKWPTDYEGYQLIVHYGIGGPSEICFGDSKIKKMGLTFKEGGTVSVQFQVQTHPNPDSSDVAKLHTLIQSEVQVSLVPPDEAKQHQIAQEKAARRQKLEEQFTEQPDDTQTGNLLEDGGDDEVEDPQTQTSELE